MKPSHPQDLEKFVHRTLRALPDRAAPADLARRVQAAIAARAALPWWRQSWAAWPAALRLLFLAVAGAAACFAVWISAHGLGGAAETAAARPLLPDFAGLARLRDLGAGAAQCLAAVIRSAPPLWLYGGLAVVAALYAACFGLGAATWRALGSRR